MSDPFVGQIQLVGFNFAPRGWAMCDGQLLPISQNTALFSLLGTFYGGDGKSTFALPDLQGRTALGLGQGPGLSDYELGQTAGSGTITLTSSNVPPHTHTFPASTGVGHSTTPSPAVALGTVARGEAKLYNSSGTSGATMAPGALASVGGSQPHNNLMPYVVMSYIIALQGVYPPRN